MTPIRWKNVLYLWGANILLVLLFGIVAGLPYAIGELTLC